MNIERQALIGKQMFPIFFGISRSPIIVDF
jgi:hypothetical protein